MLAKRWIPWHVFCFAAAGVMIWLGLWQWNVAGAPHPAGAPISSWRNYAYAVNWWIFGGVALWFWWRFMRDQKVADEKREAEWLAQQQVDANQLAAEQQGVGHREVADAAEPEEG